MSKKKYSDIERAEALLERGATKVSSEILELVMKEYASKIKKFEIYVRKISLKDTVKSEEYYKDRYDRAKSVMKTWKKEIKEYSKYKDEERSKLITTTIEECLADLKKALK